MDTKEKSLSADRMDPENSIAVIPDAAINAVKAGKNKDVDIAAQLIARIGSKRMEMKVGHLKKRGS